MIGLALSLLSRLWPYLLGAAVLFYGWHRAETWCNHACVAEQSALSKTAGELKQALDKLDVLDKERIRQQEQWAAATTAEEQRERQQEQDRKAKFAGRADAARADRALRSISVPRTSLDGLRDAYAAAEPTRPAPEPAKAATADPTAAALVGWSVDVLEWANECRSRVDAWASWYTALRQTQSSTNPPPRPE